MSDTHSRENAGRFTAEATEALTAVCELAGADEQVELTIATAFGCPFEHRVGPQRVVELAHAAISAPATAISIAATIGTAIPSEAASLVGRVTAEVTPKVGVHLHDTSGLGVANALAVVRAGAVRLDG